MPTSIVVAAVGAAISASISTVVLGVAFGAAFTAAFATSLVISGLGYLANSGSKPQQQSAPGSVTSSGRTVTVRQPITPWRIVLGRTRCGGTITYKQVTNSDSHYHMVITLAGHVCESIDEVWFGDEVVPLDGSGNATGRYAGYVRIIKSLGDEAGQPFPDLVTESGGKWTDAHRQTGHTKIYVRLIGNADLFPQGIPNITCIVKGAKVYDPRSGLTAWTDNPALLTNHYLTHATWGVGAVYADEIGAADLIASANICDEAVPLAAGGTEKRYTINGSFTLDGKPADIIPRLAAAMAGHVVKIGARWNVLAGAYATPTIELTDADLAGGIEWQAKVSRRDSCNGVRGVFASPDNAWQPTDFPALQSTGYLAEDNGDPAWHDLDLGFTDSGTMAQRIAKIDLLRTRQGLTVRFPGNLSCFRAQRGKTVLLTIAKYGWSAKPFFVSDGSFSVAGDGALGYSLVLRETAAAIYDWATSEEQVVDFAPNTDLGDPFGTPAVPAALLLSSGTAELLAQADGTIVSRIKASWAAPAGAFVVGGEIQIKPAAASDWETVARPAASDVAAWLAPVQDGATYDVRMRWQNHFGVRSGWTQAAPHVVVGKSEKPSNVASFTINGDALAWAAVTDIDLDGYILRWQAGSNRSWGDAIPLHDGLIVSSPYTLINRPSGAVTLLIKAVDTSGNESETAAFISTDLGDPILANVLETWDYRVLGWAGTLTAGTIDGGGDLVADVDVAALMWRVNDAADMWAVDGAAPMWVGSTYKAMSYIDGISVAAADAGAQLTLAHTLIGGYAIDYRRSGTAPMWGDSTAAMWTADGTALWAADPWRAWPGVVAAEAIGYDFRITTADGAVQGTISEFSASLDVPDISESINDVAIASGGTRLTLTNSYRAIKTVHLTLQTSAGAALAVRAINKSAALGPLVQCFDSTNSATTGTVDAVIQGY